MNPTWHKNQLTPTGKLKIVEATIIQNEHAIGPCILAVDEADVQWKLTHTDFIFEMSPHRLPVAFPARYRIQHRKKDDSWSGTFYTLDAAGYDDAVAKILSEDKYIRHNDATHEFHLDLDSRDSVTPCTGKPMKQEYR